MDSTRAAVRSLALPIDSRAAALVGRHARLELVFACRRGLTVLAHAYAEPPFRVGRTFRDGDGLHMILATSAPGVFGGDECRQSIRVESGARVRLTSQSALQVHPASGEAAARLTSTYQVEDDGELQCHWDPVIPFARARLHHRIEIHMNARAYVQWSDAYMSGRQARGERWAFADLAHELRMTRDGSLEYLERYHLAPESRALTRRWMAGAASYFGTTVASGRQIRAEALQRLQTELAGIAGVQATPDALGQELLLVRLIAADGVPFHEARARCMALLNDDHSDHRGAR